MSSSTRSPASERREGIPPSRLQAVMRNIFAPARISIDEPATFRWHNAAGRRQGSAAYTDADLPHSSQAFAISVWGTAPLEEANAVRSILATVIGDAAISSAAARGQPTVRFEAEARIELNELGAPNATRLDAVLTWPALVVGIESKLTERFGALGTAAKAHEAPVLPGAPAAESMGPARTSKPERPPLVASR
jgi:hypothetical protein